MRKREFLKHLSKRLGHLSKREVDDILGYYDELIEDTIDRTGKREEDVIYDLGPINDIVRRVDPSMDYAASTSKIRYDEYEESSRKSKRRKEVVYRKEPSTAGTIFVVLLLVFTSPFWIALFAVLFVIVVCAFISGFAIGISGVYAGIVGAITMTSSMTNGLFQVGVGVLLVGAAFIVAPLFMKISSLVFKLVIKMFRGLFSIASGRERRRIVYEN